MSYGNLAQSLDYEEPTDLTLRMAKMEDIPELMRLEKKYFGWYERAFTEKGMKEWFLYNPNMFYVVVNEANEVLAEAILVPVSKSLYQDVRAGKKGDIFDFPKSEVAADSKSDYFHFESICYDEDKDPAIARRAFYMLGAELAEIIYNNAKYVTAALVTEQGRRIGRTIGFMKISEEERDGKIYPIYELVITKERYDMVAPLFKRFRSPKPLTF